MCYTGREKTGGRELRMKTACGRGVLRTLLFAVLSALLLLSVNGCARREIKFCGETGMPEQHSFGAPQITPAGCVTAGYEVRVCAVCGYRGITVLLAPGHDFYEDTADPTCTANGETVRTCVRCGEVQHVLLPALGHDYSETTVPATCTEDGISILICNRCGDAQSIVLPATGHDFLSATAFLPQRCGACGLVPEGALPLAETFTDRFGRTAVLYKQNAADAGAATRYRGRYNTGRYENGTLLRGYLTTWNDKTVSGSVSAAPTLKNNGCGPVACAVVATSFGFNASPLTMVSGNDVCYSTREGVEAYFQSVGLTTARIAHDRSVYADCIAAGKKLMVLTGTSALSKEAGRIGSRRLRSGSFHWYAILDADGEGRFFVADPYLWNGGKESNCQWIDFNLLSGVYTTIAVGW